MASDSDAFERGLEKHGVQLKDDDLVTWKQDSPQHPRQWHLWTKAYITIVVTWLEAYMTAISSAGTATAKPAAKEYGIGTTLSYFVFITVYLLGQTIGAVFLAPISEVFGRRTIYIIGTATFAVSSIIVGVPHHIAGAVIGRFFQGIAAAIPATVAFGNFDDMFNADHRIWVVYLYTVFGMAGLAIGPIYSTYITATLGWRWVYHIAAIVSAISTGLCFFIKESNAIQLLEAATKDLQDSHGDRPLTADTGDHGMPSFQEFLRNHVVRPLQFFVFEPVVTLCAILCAIAFSLLYASTESLTIIYTSPPFDQTFNEDSASLAFIAILIGEILNVIPRVYDYFYLRHMRNSNQRILPESKIRSFAIACPALAVGLWILAWTVPSAVTTVPWPVSMIGLACIGFAANDFSYVLFSYVTDSYGFHAASAVSAISVSRTLAAGIFPLFVTYMYEGIGNNYATTILAGVGTVFCFTPWLFLKKGKTLREKSKWASKGDDCLKEENAHLESSSDSGSESTLRSSSHPLKEKDENDQGSAV